MSDILKDAEKILNSQSKNDILTNAEVYLERNVVTRMRMERGEVRMGQQQEIWGGAVRALVKKGIGFATFTSPETGLKAITAAITSAKVAPQNPHATIPEKKPTTNIGGTYDKRVQELPPESFQEKILEIKNVLDEKKPHGSIADVRTSLHEVALTNLNGITETAKATKLVVDVQVNLKKEENISVGTHEELSSTIEMKRTPEEVTTLAWEMAEKQLNTVKITKETLPVILHPVAVREIFGWPFPPEILGSNVVKGASPFIDKIGETVASPVVTIIDEGLDPNSFYPFPFDDEGMPKQNNTVIEKGVLKAFLYDSKTALEAKTESTGNCGRFGRYDGRSYRFMPTCATHNLKILPQKGTLDEMLDVKRGIYFVYPIGAHSANSSSGQFNVLPYIAFLVEKGELIGGIKKFIMTSTIPEILKKIDLIGNEVEHTSIEWNHQMSSPPIRLADIDIIE
ncbi:MAG: TldD/PmbA family protein [Candidatus Ranarchaeia archaeon]|jgi:PmbA protein